MMEPDCRGFAHVDRRRFDGERRFAEPQESRRPERPQYVTDMNNLLISSGRAERFGVQEVCRESTGKSKHSQVGGGASITEASSGGDLGDSNTVIGQTQVGG
jgi:hypothetical protein